MVAEPVQLELAVSAPVLLFNHEDPHVLLVITLQTIKILMFSESLLFNHEDTHVVQVINDGR